MEPIEINDQLFRRAVEAIDAGDVITLTQLLQDNSYLVTQRLDHPVDGYFKNPCLIWFIADNPIRNGKLAANIVEVTALLIGRVKLLAAESRQEQLDYALGLV